AFQNSCAATTRRLLAKRPLVARRYARAYAEAVWRFRTDAGFGLDVLGRNTGESDRSILGQTWLLFARLMGGMAFPSVEGIRNAGVVLHRLGALPAAPSPDASIDLRPIAALGVAGDFFDIMGVPPPWRKAAL